MIFQMQVLNMEKSKKPSKNGQNRGKTPVFGVKLTKMHKNKKVDN